MNDFLTTRQVQDILKVDRITIYRMLQDGRLKGVKIGQQWRFASSEIERLLAPECPPSLSIEPSGAVSSLPIHCLQTVQNLFSGISGVSAQMIDAEGVPLTRMSAPCEFCRQMMTSPSGMQACRASWREMAQRRPSTVEPHTCHAGLQYYAAPVMDSGELTGWFVVGQVYLQAPDPSEEAERVRKLAVAHTLPHADLAEAAKSITVADATQRGQLLNWAVTAAQAVESILQERTGFMQRLQQIADLTQIPQGANK